MKLVLHFAKVSPYQEHMKDDNTFAFADPAPQITPPSANNVKLTLEDSNLSNGDFTVRLFEIYLLYIYGMV
jgi:hypothetical protein